MRMHNHELAGLFRSGSRGGLLQELLSEITQDGSGDQGGGLGLVPRQYVRRVGQGEPHRRVPDPGADHVGRYTCGS
jgi:hypothetical protein